MDASANWDPTTAVPTVAVTLTSKSIYMYGGVQSGCFLNESMALTSPPCQYWFEFENLSDRYAGGSPTYGFGRKDFAWTELPDGTAHGSGTGHYLALCNGNVFLGASPIPVATGVGTPDPDQSVTFYVDVLNALAWVVVQTSTGFAPANGDPGAVPASGPDGSGRYPPATGGIDISSLVGAPLFPFANLDAGCAVVLLGAGQWPQPPAPVAFSAVFYPRPGKVR